MAIQPIDLSTMYSQMDNVARISSGQAHSEAASSYARLERSQQLEMQKSENVNEVNKNEGEGARVKSDGRNPSGDGEESEEKKEKEQQEETSGKTFQIKDPRRGRLIDITG